MSNPSIDRLAECLFSKDRKFVEFNTNFGKLEVILSSIQRKEGSDKLFILEGHARENNRGVRILYNIETQKGEGPVKYL